MSISDDNVMVIQAKDSEDAASKIENINGKVNYLYISSHGAGGKRDPYFAIGGEKFNSSSKISTDAGLARIAKKMAGASNPEVVLSACHVGGEGKGTALLTAVAKRLNATVYGSRSWSSNSTSMFRDNSLFRDPHYQNHTPKDRAMYPMSRYQYAWENIGKWSKVTPTGQVTVITDVYFNSSGRIKYD